MFAKAEAKIRKVINGNLEKEVIQRSEDTKKWMDKQRV